MYAAAGNPLQNAVQREKGHLWMDTNLFTRHIAWPHVDLGSGAEETPFAGIRFMD